MKIVGIEKKKIKHKVDAVVGRIANYLCKANIDNYGINSLADMKYEARVVYEMSHGKNCKEAQKITDDKFKKRI